MVLIISFNEILQEMNLTIFTLLYILVLLYLGMLLISILTLINLIFYIVLKWIFPYEIKPSVQSHDISLKNLSKFMLLSDQISYLIVALLNVSLIVGTAVFGVEHLSRYIDKRNEAKSEVEPEVLSILSFMNPEWFSLGTSMGILSVVIALLSIFLPVQKKIYDSAYKSFMESSNKK